MPPEAEITQTTEIKPGEAQPDSGAPGASESTTAAPAACDKPAGGEEDKGKIAEPPKTALEAAQRHL